VHLREQHTHIVDDFILAASNFFNLFERLALSR
jgi:hypothetical protein